MEDDMRSLRADMKDAMATLSGQMRTFGDQFTTLQLSLPPVYVTRADLKERLNDVSDECKQRDILNRDAIKRLEATIQKLLLVVIGSLITASLGLLNEVFHLIGKTP